MNRRKMLVGLGLGGLALLPAACGPKKAAVPKTDVPPPPEPGKEAPESETQGGPPPAPGADTGGAAPQGEQEEPK